MATKKDLIEAQGFSRRRLLSAFTGGAPGGKELDPAKPLRAVIAGIALTAAVILGGVFYGLIRPGLPQGWENNRLVLASDTGARYLSVEGVLHPVINTASARLLIPAGDFKVVSTDQGTLAGIEIGDTIGIVGAPDDLPAPDDLINTGWTACVSGDAQTSVSISAAPDATPATGDGAVVSRDGDLFVVAGGFRYAVAEDEANAVLRAVGLGAASPVAVEGRWLNLFEPGDELEAIELSDAGASLRGTDLTVGTVVHAQGTPDDERYVVLESRELAPLSPLAYQLYLLGTGADAEEREVSPAEIANLPTATTPAGGTGWPSAVLTELDAETVPCAVLGDELGVATTSLGSAPGATIDSPGVTVDIGAGALVQAGAAAPRVLIDESGTAFPIPGTNTDLIERLGYAADDVGTVNPSWIDFFAAGPSLTPEAAGQSPSTDASSSR
ncbi:type VII secretion protein EccB [Agromyces atrinae]|uniref:type VII secretion protein EccB n=1 Tax=Agromyces atrinae TaxID=592376 RepID=UPI001F59A0FE|nr:type VII secretion protein EccB [Agromyces atrinae]MCI2957451.1 type VII secretion protein EccB [Agromyces atrinae]